MMKLYLRSFIAVLLCSITCSMASAAVSFDASKRYSIKNVKSGTYLSVRAMSSFTESGTENATPLVSEPTYFTLTASGTKYSIGSDGLYVALTTSNYGWNTKSATTASAIWTIAETETPGQYTIQSTKGYLKYDGKNKFAYTDGKAGQDITWMIEEFVPYSSELVDDGYYRLKSVPYPSRYLTEEYTSNKVSGTEATNVRSPYAQMWKLKKTGTLSGTEGKWMLTNVLTGRKINLQTTQSAQYQTIASTSSTTGVYVVQKGTSNDQTYFTFGNNKDGMGLHCASSQGYSVVAWTVSAEATRWYMQEVDLTEDQLAEAAAYWKEYVDAKSAVTNINTATNRNKYNAMLSELFTDLSCSEFKEDFTEAQIKETLAEAPEAIVNMALNVKSGKWEADKDATYNNYVRNFRINSYEPYSDRMAWKNITNVGPFGQLVNPTGITVKAGEVIYIYVERLPGTGASLKLELAQGTNHTGSQVDLKQGVNAYLATEDGELFIYYFVTNTSKYVVATADHEADFTPIKVHIEGGKATGTWDMHRGMKNEDWDYLSQNMFGAEYLHVKGESTVLSLVTSKVKGATNVEGIMKIWDFIFETQERLIGHDGQWDGRYRPVITPRDVNASINPNWGGNCGTNHPGISKDYLFNFERMANDPGHNWEIYHEEAHAHQYPINLAATTESSNNGYAQMTNYEFGSYNSRNKGIETLIIFKNNDWGWVDILRGGEGCSRSEGFPYYDAALWLQCHMFFQLYQYFHIQGYMPDFWPRVADKMRSNGGIKYGRSAEAPGYYYDDYLKFAKVCAEVSQTDLWEYFDTWGFFSYCDEVKVGNDFVKENAQYFKQNDRPDIGVRFVGDYGRYFLRMPIRNNAQDEKYLADLKKQMQSYKKKAPGLMFIDDHIKPMTVSDSSFIASILPSRIGTEVKYYGVNKGTSGDLGMFWDFDGKTDGHNIYYTIVNKQVTMHGTGMVGIKIYDQNDRIVRIYNTMKFTVDADIAAGLADGTYRIEVPLSNNMQVVAPANKPVTSINSLEDGSDKAHSIMYDLTGRRVTSPRVGSIVISNGKKMIITK
ncbi:MAG: M60 family metallopeptidase [Bacteroidales bacterium]|nr:M60 family metallopeptidase [Candidatus Physcousia equi]